MELEQIRFSRSRTLFVVAVMHFIMFGLGFIVQSGHLMHKINFLTTTLIFLSSLFIVFTNRVSHIDVKQLSSIRVKMFIFGPVLYLVIMLLKGMPVFHDNTNMFRIEIRDIFWIDFVALPCMAIYLMSTFIMRENLSKRHLFLSIAFVSLIGFLSGFRGAAITPLFYYIIFLFITKKITFNFKTIIGLTIASVGMAFLLVQITQQRSGPGSDVIAILLNRIFLENATTNWNRYMAYLDQNSYTLGLTYIIDALSVVRIVELSFQELLSGGGKLVMNTPFYAEIFLNFGWFSSVVSALLGYLFGIYLLFINMLVGRGGVFVLFVFLYLYPSVLQAGITKYAFVAIPKMVIVLLIFSSNFKIFTRGARKHNI